MEELGLAAAQGLLHPGVQLLFGGRRAGFGQELFRLLHLTPDVGLPLVLRQSDLHDVPAKMKAVGDVLGDAGAVNGEGQQHFILVPESSLQGEGDAVYSLLLADEGAHAGKHRLGGLGVPGPVGIAGEHGGKALFRRQSGGGQAGQKQQGRPQAAEQGSNGSCILHNILPFCLFVRGCPPRSVR